MKTMNEEICKGCKGSCIGEPHYKTPLGITLDCPCATCLVKMICIIGCESYTDYAYEIEESELIMKSPT